MCGLRYPEARKGSTFRNWVSGRRLEMRKGVSRALVELQLMIGVIVEMRQSSHVVGAGVPCLPQKSFFCLDLSLCFERCQTLSIPSPAEIQRGRSCANPQFAWSVRAFLCVRSSANIMTSSDDRLALALDAFTTSVCSCSCSNQHAVYFVYTSSNLCSIT